MSTTSAQDKANPPPDVSNRLDHELREAEAKAWDSLARYKFQMFGYWAAIWVHMNRIEGTKRQNPWKELVNAARITLARRQLDAQPVTSSAVPSLYHRRDAVTH
jgi:hypothetical protein